VEWVCEGGGQGHNTGPRVVLQQASIITKVLEMHTDLLGGAERVGGVVGAGEVHGPMRCQGTWCA
jgi:hypothetical protein